MGYKTNEVQHVGDVKVQEESQETKARGDQKIGTIETIGHDNVFIVRLRRRLVRAREVFHLLQFHR